MSAAGPTPEDMRGFVWDALRRTARTDAARRREQKGAKPVHRALVARRGYDESSLEHTAEHVAKESGFTIGHGVMRNAVWDVYFEAFQTGLITAAVHDDAWVYSFAFTDRGLQVLLGEAPLWDSSHLGEYLQDCRARGGLISDAQIALLLEAQRCWNAACHRAAAVLLGLASEEGAERLLEAVEQSVAQAASSSLAPSWTTLKNARDPLAKRWAAAVAILEALRTVLQSIVTKGSEPQWWNETWREPIESLHLAVNHVRTQRNEAAHDAARVFGPGEITVIFPAIPVTIDRLAKLEGFLRAPPGVAVPPI